jgi:excisionase family DNA binding protein
MKNRRKKSPAVINKVVSIDPTQKGLSVPQCALYLGLSHWQVRMAIWQGKLSARKVGKSLVILRSDADKFLEGLPPVNANTSAWLANRQKAVQA